ncbi:SNF2-related protein [Asticcacaulis sp. AC402]|uniref:SNF2-related protein n=1 Tax=Asticcacaulis sp. AC402 TaxID=1282361 RepID=UPI0003C3E0E2|nr:SNF2-related protein [Asticcacaulis sp. AC402]ESQ74517.1 hypothetical protein ABAC402_13595 [Asticcacaulis sp. AC402]
MFTTQRTRAIAFSFDQDGLDVLISAQVKTLLGTKPLPFEQWSATSSNVATALTKILADIEDGRIASDGRPRAIVSDTQLRLHPELVADLDSPSASALGLPATTTLALDLQSQNLFHETSFVLKARWLRGGGGPARATVTGAIISYDGQKRRLPEPLYSLWRTAEALASPQPEAERFGLVARLQTLLPEAAAHSLMTNGYLDETRVVYASAFSLKLGRQDPFDFDPVLFGPGVRAFADEGRVPDEEVDNVLTPQQQRVFADERFRHYRDVRPAYPLRGGQYVFIDPALRPVLQEVRALQSGTVEQRREFVTHPQRVLRQRLGDEVAEASDLESLFIETEQFSARVAGVAVWTKTVLPWIKPVADAWMPEKFGIRIGDDTPLGIAPADVVPLSNAVEQAIAASQLTLEFEGQTIPATEQTRQALAELRSFVEAEISQRGQPYTSALPKSLLEKRFLTVRENFDDLEYVTLDHSPQAVVDEAFVLPEIIRSKPKPHQVEGMTWLQRLYLSGKSGGLLADDMGLGKTYQAIGFMAWLQTHLLAQSAPKRPFLIVAPTGLLANWRKEIDLHLQPPWLGDIVLAFGSNLKALRDEDSFDQKDIVAGRASLEAAAWAKAGVVLTTYETLRDYHFSFAKSPFELVVFDEIQKLKNPTSQLTKAAKTLNARFTLGMTGTPVENRLQDIWSITDVLRPGFLGLSRDFEKTYVPSDKAALRSLRGKLCDATVVSAPYMLRRMKVDHLPEMPEKTEQAKAITMPPAQALAYEDLVRRAMAGRGTMGKNDGMLQTLHAMRSVSLHPYRPDESDSDDTYVAQSARLLWTMDILEAVKAKKEKALIFVESLDMQACLARMIQTRFGLQAPPSRIHGGVPGAKRHDLVEAFQARVGSFDVMILSPKAGGVGLTLTAANHVIHLSRWWNPAVEDQSTDRVYRIGQTRPVQVYLPMAVHPDPLIGPSSFDIKLNDLLSRKRALSRDMLVAPEGDQADITELFDSVSTFAREPQTPSDEQPGLPPESPPESQAETIPEPVPATPPEVVVAQEIVPDAEPETAALPAPEAVPLAVVASKEEVAAAVSPPVSPAVGIQTRKILTLPGIKPNRPSIMLWDFPTGRARDLTEILDLFTGVKVSRLKISDPYAIANSEAREAQMAFIRDVRKVVTRLHEVAIEYDPRHSEPREAEEQSRRYMHELWLLHFNPGESPLRLERRQKSYLRDFHDRIIFLDLPRAAGAVATHELRLSRGLIGLMTERMQCSVTYVAPRA